MVAGRRILALALALACLLCLLAAPLAQARQERVVRVGWCPSDDAINPHGYEFEYLQALSQFTGWRYEYVDGSWEECLAGVRDGSIDILSFVQRTTEREQYFGYPSLPMATTSGYMVVDENCDLDRMHQ